MDKEELAEERRVLREDKVEDTGARRAPGRVTVGEGKTGIYNQSLEYLFCGLSRSLKQYFLAYVDPCACENNNVL